MDPNQKVFLITGAQLNTLANFVAMRPWSEADPMMKLLQSIAAQPHVEPEPAQKEEPTGG